jgi:hypothetical protein
MDNSNRPCGLLIVLSDDLWLTGAFPAAFPAVCGVAVEIWCSAVLLGWSAVDQRLCGAAVGAVGRIWSVGGATETAVAAASNGWRWEGFFSVIFFRPKELKEGNLDPVLLQHLHFLF